jgi:hypothetical protein
MADEIDVAAGRRFASDMKQIREDRGVSVEDLHKETRIARSLIESFEEGGLYDHSTFNEVYLRSFVRAYAEAVEISPETALDGLDDALEGAYENALAETYLQGSPAEGEDGGGSGDETGVEHPPDAPVAGGPEGRGGLVGPPRALGADESVEEHVEQDAPTAEGEETTEGEEESSASSSDTEAERGNVKKEPEPDSKGAKTTDHRAVSQPTETEGETSESAPGDEDGQQEDPSEDDSSADEAADGLDVRPSWMDDSEEVDDDSAPPPEGPASSQAPTPSHSSESKDASTASPPTPDTGETGIVGEPTALGEEAQHSPDAPRPGSAGASAEPQARGEEAGSSFWTGTGSGILGPGIGIAVVLLVMIGLGVAFFSSGETTTEPEPTSAAAPDTTAEVPADTTSSPEPPPADVTLGESVPLTILATANVSGIRIQRDEDLRRPYWIGEGTAQVFPFEQQVTIENELSDIRLFIAGYPYPVSPQDTVGGLEIRRSQVESFVDTLRGAPTPLSVSPDTIPVGAPEE